MKLIEVENSLQELKSVLSLTIHAHMESSLHTATMQVIDIR